MHVFKQVRININLFIVKIIQFRCMNIVKMLSLLMSKMQLKLMDFFYMQSKHFWFFFCSCVNFMSLVSLYTFFLFTQFTIISVQIKKRPFINRQLDNMICNNCFMLGFWLFCNNDWLTELYLLLNAIILLALISIREHFRRIWQKQQMY